MSSPKTPVQPPTNAVSPQNASADKATESDKNRPVPPKVEPAPKHRQERYYASPDPTPLWKIFLECGAVAVGIFVAVIYHGQLNVMQDQLTEARNYTRLSQRPWIGLDDEGGALVTGPLVFDQHAEGNVPYTVKVKNFGQFGAQNVGALVELIIPKYTINSVEKARAMTCNGYVGEDSTFLLFPGKNKVLNSSVAHSVTNPTTRIAEENAAVFLVGCILFRDQFGCEYYTEFTYTFQNSISPHGLPFKPEAGKMIDGKFELSESSMGAKPCAISAR